jgi:hypothetical protein
MIYRYHSSDCEKLFESAGGSYLFQYLEELFGLQFVY